MDGLLGSGCVLDGELSHPFHQHCMRGSVGLLDKHNRLDEDEDDIFSRMALVIIQRMNADLMSVEVLVALLTQHHKVAQLVDVHQIENTEHLLKTLLCRDVLMNSYLIQMLSLHANTIHTNESTAEAGIVILRFTDLRLIGVA